MPEGTLNRTFCLSKIPFGSFFGIFWLFWVINWYFLVFFGMFWRKPALTPTKNYENKTVCVFFQGASDANVKTSRNIARKSKNSEILNLKKSDFQKSMKNGFEPSNIYSFSRRIRIRIQNWTKTSPRPDF